MPNPHRLIVLEELRYAAGLTLEQMAQACGLAGKRGRLSVSAWERGQSIPHARRRTRFIDYLGTMLGLSADPARFHAVWAVLVEEWQWDEVSEQEWQQHFDPPPNTSTELLGHSSTPPQLPTDRLPPPAPLPPGSRVPWSRNPLFVGRDADLLALATALRTADAAAPGQPNTVAATGLGGIGKTQLVCEFVHRYGQFFTGGVFWLSFADPDAASAEIAACGGPSHMHLQPDYERLLLDQQAQLVLAAWQSDTPRLLIFDNCEDPALLARWRPQGRACRVLITSRRAQWPADLRVRALPLGLLGRRASIALLRNHFPDLPLNDVDLAALAAELDDLPLALHLAGSYLARFRHAVPPAAYLHQLRAALLQHPSLQNGTISPTGHEQHVARTFRVSYRQLDTPRDAHARALLARAAYFAPGEPISRDLLLATLCADGAHTLDEEAALWRLLELGLLEHTGKATYRMHRLLVAFVRQIAPDDGAQTAVERALLAAVKPLNEAEAYPQVHALQTHLRAVTHAAAARQDESAADLCHELGEYLLQIEEYPGARHYLNRAIAIRSALFGENHPSLATSLHRLAWMADGQGHMQEALQQHQRALAIRRAALGDDHPATVESWDYAGTILHAIGDFAQAEAHYQRAYAIRRRELGERHPDTLTCVNNLGLLYLFWGCYAEAQRYLAQALAIREQTLEAHRSRLAISLNNMGYLLRATARYDEAAVLLTRALSIRKELFGHENSYVATTLNHLGRICQARGEYDRAQGYLTHALGIMQTVLPNSFWHGNLLSSVGMLCYDHGDYQQARPYLEQALAIHQQVYPFPHWHTARSLNHLAMLHHAERDYTRAAHLYQQALNMRAQLLGAQHPDTANTFSHLGMLWLKQGDVARATPLLERALTAHQERLGGQHPYTARSLMRLGLLRRAQGCATQAAAAVTQALTVYEHRLGAQHPHTACCRDVALLGA